MKEPFSFEEGRVVQSTQGRDRGGYFIVLESSGDGYVMMADGLNHRLDRPKKKKTKHLRAKPVLIDLKTARPEGGKLQDSDLRRALENNGFAVERSLCKEG
ncbi:MAG: KOW domain-containing RNA-binding protein [Clostridia bacterium]|jgi:ribosomal protein L14E/L6E/L27E|nr:KOW domain-containing RNA-binding protein [Clostridia bacterium]